MRFPRNVRVFRGQLDASPFVGVLFLLVLFLLLNSTMVFTPGIPLRLPEAEGWPGTTNATVVVALDERGQLYFQHQVTPEDQLRTNLLRAVEASPVPLTLILLADREVSSGTLVRMVNLARESGIQDALMAVRPPPRPPARGVAP